MTLRRYPEYKASGVEWLGEVPAHWTRTRTRTLFRQQKRQDQTGKPVLSVYRDYGVIEKDSRDDNINKTPEDISAYQTVNPGDLVVNKMKAWQGSLGISPYEGVTSPDYAVFAPSHRECPEFLHFLFRCKAMVSFYRSISSGIRPDQWRLEPDSFLGLPTFLPPADEQTHIVEFLERETAKIGALVVGQQQLIELLREKSQAVISHAVTKGLNPSAPMKDSGIECLGEVPAHWEVSALKRFCDTITDGAHVSPETVGGEYPFISTKDVSAAGIDFANCLLTSAASFEQLTRNGCRPRVGDVLFSKDGTVGRTIVVSDARAFVVASSLIIIRPLEAVFDPRYLDLLCQSQSVAAQVETFVKGAGLPRLSIQNLTRVIACRPPISEQRAIVDFLEARTQASNPLAVEALHAIDILQERRAALISAAVTGQIDVRPQSQKA